jgi:hypothetical protein
MSGIAPIVDFEAKDYNPFLLDAQAYGDIEDIHGRLSILRDRAPVQKGDLLTLLGWSVDPNVSAAALPQFTVLGYEEVLKVDGDSETYSIDAYESGLGLTFGRTLSLLNPPEHPPRASESFPAEHSVEVGR